MTPSISALVIKKILYTKGHQGVVCVFPVSGGALGFESWKGLSASEASLLPSWSDGERGGPGSLQLSVCLKSSLENSHKAVRPHPQCTLLGAAVCWPGRVAVLSH